MQEILDTVRLRRNFNADFCLSTKIELLNQYFEEHNIDSCVVGLSGGLDSSVVYRLLEKCNVTVFGMFLPFYNSTGVTGQNEALKYVDLLDDKCEKINLDELSKTFAQLLKLKSNWGIGQVDSIIRTPMLYGKVVSLQEIGRRPVVVGTTNRDEGSYIGFFGKASDAMVDLQPIGDLHKSEVTQLAKLLNVPQEIIDRNPTGDTFDASLDEKTFGCPYWFLEIFAYYKNNENEVGWRGLLENHPYWKNVEALHKKNAHKYLVDGYPSVFFDVYERKINEFY